MNEPPTHPGDDRSEEPELPESVVEEAERLTRLARRAVDDDERGAYRTDREETLAEYGFTARVRGEESREVLVLHPREWVRDGTIRPSAVDDVDRAVEVVLSGAADPGDWDEVDRRNRELVAAVRSEHGDVHGANAAALADFMGNHYAKPIPAATGAELREFLEEYFPRNAFPSAEQKATVGRSVELVFETAGESVPDL